MREEKRRRLFLRYAEHGDLEALAAVFEATAPALLALGRHLASSRDDAEDALQSTFLTAIERRSSYDRSLPLESWLLGILLHKVRRAGQQAARRPDPERVGEPTSEDPAQAARSSELADSLGEAIAALPRSYRRVLEPYLREDLRPREIAKREGVAAGTVRVRIHRGLRMLRKSLPAGFTAGSLAALAGSPELVRLRASVLRAGRIAVPPAGGPLAIANTGAVATRLLAACGVIVVAVGAWQYSSIGPGDVEAVELSVVHDETSNSPESGAASASADLELDSDDTRVAAKAREGRGAASTLAWTLELYIHGLAVLPPGPLGVEIHSRPDPQRTFRVPITADGIQSVRLPLDWTAEDAECPALSLRFEHPAYASWSRDTSATDVSTAGTLMIEFELERRFSVIHGRVVGDCYDDDRNAASPSVGFFADDLEHALAGASFLTPRTHRSCDGEGNFRLYVEASSGWLVAAAPGCAPIGIRLECSGIEDHDLGTLELGPGAVVEGVAYVEGRAPVGAARVVAERLETEDLPRGNLARTQFAFLEHSVVSLRVSTLTDPSGHFRLTGLCPGPHGVLLVPRMRISGTYDVARDGTWVEAPVTGIELESLIHAYTLESGSTSRAAGALEGNPARDRVPSGRSRTRARRPEPGWTSRLSMAGLRSRRVRQLVPQRRRAPSSDALPHVEWDAPRAAYGLRSFRATR